MEDSIFRAYLTKEGLFGNGDLKDEVLAKSKSSKMAEHFLDKAITPYINDKGDLGPLRKLLNLMEQHEGPAGRLAKEMKKAIPTLAK